MFDDRMLSCAECGSDFVFTAGEQELFEDRGYHQPKRCPACRAARRGGPSPDASGGTRERHPIICAQCGAEDTVPFRPRGDRPVYCQECYRIMRRGP